MVEAGSIKIDKFVQHTRKMPELESVGGLGIRIIGDGRGEEVFFKGDEWGSHGT